MRTVLSRLPLASRVPRGLKVTLVTVFMCPCSVIRHSPVTPSHMRTVLSRLPLASRVPRGLKATLVTLPEWPRRVAVQSPMCPVRM
jgi:hypothetical protein